MNEYTVYFIHVILNNQLMYKLSNLWRIYNSSTCDNYKVIIATNLRQSEIGIKIGWTNRVYKGRVYL